MTTHSVLGHALTTEAILRSNNRYSSRAGQVERLLCAQDGGTVESKLAMPAPSRLYLCGRPVAAHCRNPLPRMSTAPCRLHSSGRLSPRDGHGPMSICHARHKCRCKDAAWTQAA